MGGTEEQSARIPFQRLAEIRDLGAGGGGGIERTIGRRLGRHEICESGFSMYCFFARRFCVKRGREHEDFSRQQLFSGEEGEGISNINLTNSMKGRTGIRRCIDFETRERFSIEGREGLA